MHLAAHYPFFTTSQPVFWNTHIHTHTHKGHCYGNMQSKTLPLCLLCYHGYHPRIVPFLARPSHVLVSHNLQGKPQFNPSDILHSSLFPLFLVDIWKNYIESQDLDQRNPGVINLQNTVAIATAKVNICFCYGEPGQRFGILLQLKNVYI